MAVLVDLYSTLVHEHPGNPFYNAVIASLKLDGARWQERYQALGLASMIGDVPDMATRVQEACVQSGQPREARKIWAVVNKWMPMFYAHVQLDPEALSMLGRLQAAGVQTAIVSNASSYSERLLDDLDLRTAVDHVTMSYRVGVLKPDPRIYMDALDALDVSPAQATFIGDGGNDELLGAQRLGLRTILVDRALTHSRRARAYSDVVCGGLSAAASIILAKVRVDG